MPERLLHYIWQQCLFMRFEQQTTDGRKVEVIDVGRLNTDGGPDFFNAKVIIDGQLWAGNIEIHINSSDWFRHHHDSDKAYDSVILHVVMRADAEVCRTNGEQIPQCELRFPDGVQRKYLDWLVSETQIPCKDDIAAVPKVYIEDWKSSLLADRLLIKTQSINDLLLQNRNSWEETFYITLAHYFGFHTNGTPFELLAKQTPLAFLGKHRDNLFQLEAMLFGQSGMLDDNVSQKDDYYSALLQEYRFLKTKFGLSPIDGSMWKRLRMRPDNFPTVRIAEFAALLNKSDHLFATLMETQTIIQMRKILDVQASEYWDTHYQFNTVSVRHPKRLGKNAIDTLIINVVVPFLFAYGIDRDQPAYEERAEMLLDKIPAESNSVIHDWRNIGLEINSAADSQALIHLHEHYCSDHRCLHCRIATKILSRE